jgi:hypothetical protein
MTQPAASFSAASPCTFLFVEETLRKRDHDKCAPSGTKRQSLNFHPESLGVREASRQHWETLKPLIQRIYIDEDRPYPYLAHLLRTEHGFETTYDSQTVQCVRLDVIANRSIRKRQFSRKIIEWGFRKNVSSIERRDILQTLSDDKSYSTLGFKDPRLKPEKIKNWRKRYRDEADEQLCHDPLSHTSSSLGEFISFLLRELFY